MQLATSPSKSASSQSVAERSKDRWDNCGFRFKLCNSPNLLGVLLPNCVTVPKNSKISIFFKLYQWQGDWSGADCYSLKIIEIFEFFGTVTQFGAETTKLLGQSHSSDLNPHPELLHKGMPIWRTPRRGFPSSLPALTPAGVPAGLSVDLCV